MFIQCRFAVAAPLIAWLGPMQIGHAQTLLEQSSEVRMQIDFAVPPAALKALLPDGWEPAVAAAGPAKDCNIRVIFVDRVDIDGPDGAPVGTDQMVYLASPIKKTGSNDMLGQMVIDGITADNNNAPGPFKVYHAATSFHVERKTHAVSGKAIDNEESWEFTAADGEHIMLQLSYERGVARKSSSEIKFFSAADPNVVQISKIDQGLDIMRNATVAVKDKVKQFEVKASGGRIASLFDGTQRVLSIDALHWYNRGVYAP